MKDYFNEDCMQGMKRYPDKFFDLAIVDPPYGIETLNREKSNRLRKYGDTSQANVDVPDKAYFDELFRVSKTQVICYQPWIANRWKEVKANVN